MGSVTPRRLWQILVWLAPVLAVAVLLSVLRGAGVPVSLPVVLVVVAVLVVVRLAVGRRRRLRGRGRKDG